MNTFDEDEALARLRAADPASGAHPDLHKISQRLRGQTPLDSGSGGFAFSDTSDTAVRVHDPSVRTGRGGILVAAAVAALALGGGGYALGTTTAHDDTPTVAANDSSSDDGSSAVTDDGGFEHGISAAAEDSGDAEMHSDEGDMSEESMGGGYSGPVIPVAGQALSTERTTSKVYGASTDSAWTNEQVNDLLQGYADALGIEGTVQDDDGTFAHVTDPTDGRNMAVYSYGANSSLDYNNPAMDPWCADMKAEMEASGEDYGWFGYGSDGPDDITCAELGPRPDDATALATAEEFLSQLGVDYTGYTLEVQPAYGPEMYGMGGGDEASATSLPDIWPSSDQENALTEIIVSTTDGPLAGFQNWHLSVSSEGVTYASIQFGDYVELGDYPVISPAEAVERANDTRFQQLGAYIPDLEYTDTSGYEWVEPEPLPPVAPGERIPYPLTESPVTSAELHTGIVSLWDGTEYLVPVYALSDGEGNTWEVMGLAEEALNFTP